MESEIKNVFISHIHEDDSKLSNLKSLLSEYGIDARDYSINSDNPNNAKSEDYIKTKILAPQIQKAGAFIVYVSEATKNSDYVNWEIEYAHKLGKRIIGVWGNGEDGCELPEALEDYRDALVGWNGENLVDAILGDDTVQENPDCSPRAPRAITQHPC